MSPPPPPPQRAVSRPSDAMENGARRPSFSGVGLLPVTEAERYPGSFDGPACRETEPVLRWRKWWLLYGVFAEVAGSFGDGAGLLWGPADGLFATTRRVGRRSLWGIWSCEGDSGGDRVVRDRGLGVRSGFSFPALGMPVPLFSSYTAFAFLLLLFYCGMRDYVVRSRSLTDDAVQISKSTVRELNVKRVGWSVKSGGARFFGGKRQTGVDVGGGGGSGGGSR